MNDQPMPRVAPWAVYDGRLLRDMVDDLWRAAALKRAEEDPNLRRWRAIHDGINGGRKRAAEGRRRRIAPPPSDALLGLLLGAAWWSRFRAFDCDVEPVQREIDPLHRYSTHVAGPARARVVDEIEALRPALLAQAVVPVVDAIGRGEVNITGLAGTEPVALPADLLGSRQWWVQRDGALVIPDVDGTQRIFLTAKIKLPNRPSVDTEAMPPGGKIPPRGEQQYSKVALGAWFVLREKTWPKDVPFPNRDTDLAAAQAVFGRFPPDEFRRIRREKTSLNWRKRGPRRKP